MNLDRRKRKVRVNTEISEPGSSILSNSDVSRDPNKKSKKYKPRQRQENSLGELTKNVINYIKKNGKKEINISTIVNELQVKKRRIYDITNVLEGIGCIQKVEKNKIKWIDDSLYKDHETAFAQEMSKMSTEMNSLINEEKSLDKWIQDIKNSYEILQEDPKYKKYGYLTYNDIRLLTEGDDMNIIAIRAPSGTSIDIPDPENVDRVFTETNENMSKGLVKYDKDLLDSLEKKYQLFLESPNGEINVYLVLSPNNNEASNLELVEDKILLNNENFGNFKDYSKSKN